MFLYRLSKIRRQGKLSKPANIPAQTTVALQTFIDRITKLHRAILRAAKVCKDTQFNNVFIRKWVSNEEREKDKALRGICFKLNDKFPPGPDYKKLYIVIDGHISRKLQNCSFDFKKLVDHEKFLAAKPQPINVTQHTHALIDSEMTNDSVFLVISIMCVAYIIKLLK